VCVRVVVNRYVCTVVTVYRPGSESVQSAFLAELVGQAPSDFFDL